MILFFNSFFETLRIIEFFPQTQDFHRVLFSRGNHDEVINMKKYNMKRLSILNYKIVTNVKSQYHYI